MRKTTIFSLLAILFSFAIVIQSCKKDDDSDDPQVPAEFEADNSTFSDFETWTLQDSIKGPDPAIGSAHGPNDSTVTRKIYVKDGQTPTNGVYPQGTVIVKHSSNPAGTINEFTGMVKRGGNFNPNNDGWEWFILNADGTINNRGAKLNAIDCGGCHSFANVDYVYSAK